MRKYVNMLIHRSSKEVECTAECDLHCMGDIEIYVIGDLYASDRKHACAEDIRQCYIDHGTNTYDYIDGTGLVVIYDHTCDRIFVFTDFFNAAVPIFYAKNRDYIIVTTDTLFATSHLDRVSIDKHGVKEFVRCSMVYGNRTMVKQVKKLATKHYLCVDLKRNKVSSHECHYTFNPVSEKNYKLYSECIRRCVSECDSPDAVCTLSKGFDTNFILYHLRDIRKQQEGKADIQAYTAAGVRGRDEIPEARQIAEFYGDVNLNTVYVDETSFQNLPEIVYAMQGISYERGVFMHLDLAKKLRSDGVHRIFSGDAAHTASVTGTYTYDWVTFKLQLRGFLRHIKHSLRNEHHYYLAPYRFDHNICALMSIKKEGQLWNYLGIQGIFPFGRKPFLEMAKSISVPGVTGKQYHIASFKSVLPEGVLPYIARLGGDIDTWILFDEELEKRLIQLVKTFPWFINWYFPDINHQLDIYIRMLMVDIYRRIFIEKEVDVTHEFPKLKDMYSTLIR